ncbi:hypothetical protein NDU88_006612 [Pleurodeles waltl]|uniref:Uncharacterized protein n=1 Tax=Pleurodeles waltl TaxID=8319 RepID=A0AAV7NSG5_PLEWA|nr:hypothetical protein NDU88_006612 [Pleurodeles waltl]
MIVSGQVAPLRRLEPLLQLSLTRGALMVKVQLRLLRIMFTHGEERPTGSRRAPPAKAPSLLHNRVAAPAQAPPSAHDLGSSHGSRLTPKRAPAGASARSAHRLCGSRAPPRRWKAGISYLRLCLTATCTFSAGLGSSGSPRCEG